MNEFFKQNFDGLIRHFIIFVGMMWLGSCCTTGMEMAHTESMLKAQALIITAEAHAKHGFAQGLVRVQQVTE